MKALELLNPYAFCDLNSSVCFIELRRTSFLASESGCQSADHGGWSQTTQPHETGVRKSWKAMHSSSDDHLDIMIAQELIINFRKSGWDKDFDVYKIWLICGDLLASNCFTQEQPFQWKNHINICSDSLSAQTIFYQTGIGSMDASISAPVFRV